MKFTNPNADVIKYKKLYIFDMVGTIYLGGNPFDFAIRYIKNLRENGKKVLFFTNNASHTIPFYMKKFSRLGVEPREDVDNAEVADKPDFVFNSLDDVDNIMFE